MRCVPAHGSRIALLVRPAEQTRRSVRVDWPTPPQSMQRPTREPANPPSPPRRRRALPWSRCAVGLKGRATDRGEGHALEALAGPLRVDHMQRRSALRQLRSEQAHRQPAAVAPPATPLQAARAWRYACAAYISPVQRLHTLLPTAHCPARTELLPKLGWIARSCPRVSVRGSPEVSPTPALRLQHAPIGPKRTIKWWTRKESNNNSPTTQG